MESGHEMEVLFNYYLGNGQHCDGVTMDDRFSTFSTDLGLVDDQGRLKDDAADAISDEVSKFFHLNNFIENVKNPIGLGSAIVDRNAEFIPTSDIPNLINQASEAFIDMIDQGLQQEALDQVWLI